MKLRVLLVEDNKALSRNILFMLRKEGFVPSNAYDVEEAREKFLREKPHVVLLDIMLPSGDGRELAAFFRRDPNVSIIMLTALDYEESKQAAYQNGADDYITKPFSLKELAYKLRALQRRIISAMREYRVGDILFDIESGRIECNGNTETLTRNQAGFLKALYIKKQSGGGCLAKGEIFDSAIDESGRIHTMVNKLRDKLKKVGSEKVLIETVYGKGYRLDVVDSGAKDCE